MNRRYKSSLSVAVSLFLVFSLLPLGYGGFVLAENDNNNNNDSDGSDIKVRIVKNLNEEYAADEVIVKYKNDKQPRTIKLATNKSVHDAVREFKTRSDVEYVEPNFIARAFMVPNDPYFPLQWHLDNSQYGGINVSDAWDISTGSNVIVAVIDTGVAYENYCDLA